jgi:prepilin-type N-terminal cleavage/methylation domain-containing protein
MRGTSRRRGFTLIEAVIAMTILTVVAIGVGSLIQGSAETSNLVSASTRVQLKAERVIKQVENELRQTGVQGGGMFTLDHSPAGPGVVWEMRYHILDPKQPIFNAGTPSSPPWSPEWRILRCEQAETVDGIDNDGDYLIDEKKLVLYVDDGVERQLAVLGDDLTSFEAGLARPRVRLRLTVDWLLRSAVKNKAEIQDHRNPQKNLSQSPWVRYVADTWFTFPS